MYSISSGEIRSMLETCARRWIESEWLCELDTKPKLAVLWLLKEKGSESRCMDVASKRIRRVMMRLRDWTAPLRIESGWWQGLPREERTCQECQSGEVEDVAHWLFECDTWGTERQPLLLSMRHIANDFDNLCDDDELALVLNEGSQHLSILKNIVKMWTARFE